MKYFWNDIQGRCQHPPSYTVLTEIPEELRCVFCVTTFKSQYDIAVRRTGHQFKFNWEVNTN